MDDYDLMEKYAKEMELRDKEEKKAIKVEKTQERLEIKIDINKRKTLDDYVGTAGLLILGFLGLFIRGGVMGSILAVCGLTGLYRVVTRKSFK